MAKLIDFGGSVDSNLVQGIGTNSVTFTMPGNVGLAVESVLATVNNAAGAATGAMITIRDQSGEVIARQRQSTTLDAGATGTATWALRLGGNGGTPLTATWARYRGSQVIPVLPASGSLDYILVDGTALLDLTNPLIPTVLTAGVFMASMQLRCVGITTGATMKAKLQMDPYGVGSDQTIITAGGISGENNCNPTGFMSMAAGGFINNIISHNQAGADTFSHTTDIVRFA